MRTFLYFLWIVMSPSLFAESSTQEASKEVNQTIHLLRELGHKVCPDDVAKAMSDRFTSLPIKKQELSQALKIAYNSTFELFKNYRTHCHWTNNAFQDLIEHLNRQAKSHFVPVMSSALERLVENFKELDQFLTQQNFSCCAWENVRQDILRVMDHFKKMTRPRRKHV
ncbi:hypothetical protein cypCar_00019537 [Cyprinus carpio]|nr:hypothetical protein cypCar_00019537 [Cyprinus carpio]